MQIVYSGHEPPLSYSKSIFLAGPTPRKPEDLEWRKEAISILELLGYDGVVYYPEWAPGESVPDDYSTIIEWETQNLNRADTIVFWVPRDMERAPALTTNIEFGTWIQSGKCVVGWPPEAEKTRYLEWWANHEFVNIHAHLKTLLVKAISKLGDGCERSGGERDVPLMVWLKPEFQTWYETQLSNGNVLNSARVEWTFRVGKKREKIFLWALYVNMHIGREGRDKTNEVVIFRPSISVVVPFWKHPTNPWLSKVVLIREYRSPVSNTDSYVLELPGGSCTKPDVPPEAVALAELKEETGLDVEFWRLSLVQNRQILSTLSAHHATLYSVSLTDDEIQLLEADKSVHGVESDTERTWVEVKTLMSIMTDESLDWSAIGQICSVLSCP